MLTALARLFTSATPNDALLDGITSVLTKIGDFFTTGFTAVTGIFWDSVAGEMTFVGWLVIIGIGAGIISSLLAMVFGLLRNIRIGGRRR